MTRLPTELVESIFQAIQDDSTATPYEWWTVSDQCHRFFDNASLVCKMWYELTKPFRTFHKISGNAACVPASEWKGGYARNGRELSKVLGVTALHIDWMDEDEDRLDFVVIAPLCLPSVLMGCEASLNSLSLQAELVLPTISTNIPGLGDILRQVLNKVERLHVYSNQEDAFARRFGGTIGYGIKWEQLASAVWAFGRTAALRVLALSETTIYTELDKPVHPCPADTLMLTDVYFDESNDLSDCLPNCKHLIWKQTAIWDSAFWGSPSSSQLNLTSTSRTLVSISVIWEDVDCKVLPSKDLLMSPNLGTLDFQLCCSCCQGECDNPLEVSSIPGKDMPFLQELRIECAQDTYKPQVRSLLCEKLKDPLFCPRLARTPVEGYKDSRTILFLAK